MWPGSASIFTPRSGIASEWMTSNDVTSSLTTIPAWIHRSGDDEVRSSYVKFQTNWVPMTVTVVSGVGSVSVYTRTGTEMMRITIRMIVGTTVHTISTLRLPSIHVVGRGETASRYRTRKMRRAPKTTIATMTAKTVIAQNRFWISTAMGPALLYALAGVAANRARNTRRRTSAPRRAIPGCELYNR